MQLLDELDDVVAAIRLVSERIRRFLLFLSLLVVSTLAPIAGILLALRHPPIAMATAMILFVTLIYRAATMPASAFRSLARFTPTT
ncbi:MAG: hypothetical protein OEW64_14945 [Gammaproteobacteria bacterium]|nr:hypothetical protein [Gammaproteobacteria bacterium]MDH5305383.1 hypothetical protein [Gammaproteobacteria bacterium]